MILRRASRCYCFRLFCPSVCPYVCQQVCSSDKTVSTCNYRSSKHVFSSERIVTFMNNMNGLIYVENNRHDRLTFPFFGTNSMDAIFSMKFWAHWRHFKNSGRVNLSCRHLCIYNLKAVQWFEKEPYELSCPSVRRSVFFRSVILPWRDGKLHFHAPIGTLVSHDSNVLQYQKPVAAFAIIILRFIIDTLANVHVYMLQILTIFATFYHYVWSCVSFVYIWLDWMIQ